MLGQDDPGSARARDFLDASRAGKNIAPPNRALAIAPFDQSHVVSRSENDVAAEDRPRPIDRARRLHRDVGTEFRRRERLFLRRRGRIRRGGNGRGRRDDLLLELVDAGGEIGRFSARFAVDALVELSTFALSSRSSFSTRWASWAIAPLRSREAATFDRISPTDRLRNSTSSSRDLALSITLRRALRASIVFASAWVLSACSAMRPACER